jgi:hypothetical protein
MLSSPQLAVTIAKDGKSRYLRFSSLPLLTSRNWLTLGLSSVPEKIFVFIVVLEIFRASIYQGRKMMEGERVGGQVANQGNTL